MLNRLWATTLTRDIKCSEERRAWGALFATKIWTSRWKGGFIHMETCTCYVWISASARSIWGDSCVTFEKALWLQISSAQNDQHIQNSKNHPKATRITLLKEQPPLDSHVCNWKSKNAWEYITPSLQPGSSFSPNELALNRPRYELCSLSAHALQKPKLPVRLTQKFHGFCSLSRQCWIFVPTAHRCWLETSANFERSFTLFICSCHHFILSPLYVPVCY